MYIKYISYKDLGEDFNKDFSYIISGWLIKEGGEYMAMILYIIAFYPTSPKNKFSVFIVVALGSILLALQYQGVLVGLANKITLARMPVCNRTSPVTVKMSW